MKTLLYIFTLLLIGACATSNTKENSQGVHIKQPNKIRTYAKTITAKELKAHLYTFASNAYQGRRVGTKGQKEAVQYLKNYYIKEGIASPYGDLNYFQDIPKSYLGNMYNNSENVLAFIKGSEKPDEVIIISAHLDHMGINENGEIYNGADDDGSGTVALLEIAQAFKKAKDKGFGPKRSILFLHVTAEEIGLQGSLYYTENPVFSLKNTIANLNIDMIGRIDEFHKEQPNYLYLIGSDRLSTELHNLSETVNNKFSNIELDYKYNDKNDPNRFYYRSDHYNFAKHNIPVIFYFNGVHEDYHQITDTPDKINYPILEKRIRLIFATAWQLANQKKRIVVDKS